MSTYAESETGALLCDECDKYIDGIGENRCKCCRDCGGTGAYMDDASEFECESCYGTGRHGYSPEEV